MKNDLFISDKRMLELMQFCIDNYLSEGATAWCDTIGFQQNNLSNIKDGKRSFTKEHMYAAALAFNVNMEYLFGFTDVMFREDTQLSPLQLLKQAVRAVENDMRSNRASNKKLASNYIKKK